ncbi:hypothetical protein EZS27_008324 [termite gut metagenome]|uniref:Uncharacterized protein n=1 Tax=termite gut metagenome TaxID=433724 RepID=A0A5J4SEZ7_9ZZZZ
MLTKFLYIDDDKIKDAEDKVQGFEQEGCLKITTQQHKGTWEEQLKFIKNFNETSMDGLILDLRLDDFPNEKNERADFRGTSLAQEIRTRQKEKEFRSFPIVLFSANDKLKKSLENSGKDLFDICIDKSKVNAASFDIYTPRLISLAEGYKFLSGTKEVAKILDVDINVIDDRFLSELSQLLNNPVHIISQFIIYELIEKQGLLIDDQVLAARLGIDIENSQDWGKVIESLFSSKYSGAFSGGWQRWWALLVEKWWKDTIQAEPYLRSTPAEERVALIKNALKLDNLQSAQKIDKADSEEFWTVCKGYNLPLDPVDGLIIEGQEKLYPWQEPEYVSIDAALKRKNISEWKNVAKIEEEHLKELQETYKKSR